MVGPNNFIAFRVVCRRTVANGMLSVRESVTATSERYCGSFTFGLGRSVRGVRYGASVWTPKGEDVKHVQWNGNSKKKAHSRLNENSVDWYDGECLDEGVVPPLIAYPPRDPDVET
jgi:hypothetical protein